MTLPTPSSGLISFLLFSAAVAAGGSCRLLDPLSHHIPALPGRSAVGGGRVRPPPTAVAAAADAARTRGCGAAALDLVSVTLQTASRGRGRSRCPALLTLRALFL